MAQQFGRHVLLVGLPGTGKSTVAPAVAAGLAMAWVDLDVVVEGLAGLSVAEVFDQQGEAAFRELELSAFAQVLDGPPTVIAGGGGLLVSAEARTSALRCTVVWLRAQVSTLVERLGPATERSARPLLAPVPSGDASTERQAEQGSEPHEERLAASLKVLAQQRDHVYARSSDVVVDVDGRSEDEVAGAVIDALAASQPPSGQDG